MWLPPHPFLPQLRVHAEFLPDLFPAADLGGICVCDLLLREGESSRHLGQHLLLSPPSHCQGLRPSNVLGMGEGQCSAGPPLLTGIGGELGQR